MSLLIWDISTTLHCVNKGALRSITILSIWVSPLVYVGLMSSMYWTIVIQFPDFKRSLSFDFVQLFISVYHLKLSARKSYPSGWEWECDLVFYPIKLVKALRRGHDYAYSCIYSLLSRVIESACGDFDWVVNNQSESDWFACKHNWVRR